MRPRNLEELALGRRALGLDQEILFERHVERRVEAHHAVHAVDRGFGPLEKRRLDGGHAAGDRERGLDLVAGGHDAVNEADLVGAPCSNLVLAGEQDFLRVLGPGEPGHQHHDDAGAEAQLGLAEAGILGRHGHVAGERELAAAGERRAPHRSDGRFREMPEAHHGVEVVPQHLAPGGDAYGRGGGLLLEVEAR